MAISGCDCAFPHVWVGPLTGCIPSPMVQGPFSWGRSAAVGCRRVQGALPGGGGAAAPQLPLGLQAAGSAEFPGALACGTSVQTPPVTVHRSGQSGGVGGASRLPVTASGPRFCSARVFVGQAGALGTRERTKDPSSAGRIHTLGRLPWCPLF